MLRTRVHRTRRPLLPFFPEGRPTANATQANARTSSTYAGSRSSTSYYGIKTSQTASSKPTPPPTQYSGENQSQLRGVFGSIYRSQGNKFGLGKEKVIRKEAFTPEQFTSAWYQFVQIIPEHPDIHFLFKEVPEIKEGNKIELVLTNSAAQQKLQALSPKLKAYLGDKLQNDTFEFDVQLVIDNTPAATAQEKMEMMIDKNKDLKKLLEDWHLHLS